jgi:hypothetical protein
MESATVIHLWCVCMCVCARAVHYCRTRARYYAHYRTLPHISEAKQIPYTIHTHTSDTLSIRTFEIMDTTHVRHTIHQTPKTLHSQYACGAGDGGGGGGGGGGPELGGGLGPPKDGIFRSLCDFPTFPFVAP